MKTERFSFWMTPETRKKLRDLAHKKRITDAECLRQLIEQAHKRAIK